MKRLARTAFSGFILAPTLATVIAVIVFRRQNHQSGTVTDITDWRRA